jgi:hypothetical protein
MITRFSGKRYDFEIHTEEEGCYSTFYIRAICKDTGKYSSINNLNTILDVLGVDINKPTYGDSSWVVTSKEAEHLGNITKRGLSSPLFKDYLECQLDEDKDCGEWTNMLQEYV